MSRKFALSAFVFYIFFIPSIAHARDGTNGHVLINRYFSHCGDTAASLFYFAADTTKPPPADSVKKAPKKSIWQRIAGIFAFRARADKRWNSRAKALIDSMGIMDSITAQHNNVRVLTDSQKVYYNSLLSMVDSIEKKIARLAKKDSVAGKGKNNPPGGGPVPVDSSGFSPVTDDIQALEEKLSPLIGQQTAAAAEALKKGAYLAVLSQADFPGKVSHTSGDTVIQFRYLLGKRTGIYGFHNYTTNGKYAGYQFDHITGLLYNAVVMNSTAGLFTANGWDTARVIQDAREAGTGVYANFLMQDRGRIKAFLRDSTARDRFVRKLEAMLATGTSVDSSRIASANKAPGRIMGINIAFDELSRESSAYFVDFIKQIRNSPRFADSTYQLFITIPIVDIWHAYNLSALNQLADKFIVNFIADSLHPPIGRGPVFPLNGGQPNSISTCVSRLTGEKVLPGKLVIGIPYFGARWLVSKASGAGRFIQYLNYSDIRAKSGWSASTDPATGATYMDSSAGARFHDSVYRIWFDDENTLGAKYDYVVSSRLGGIAISTLGYDAGYGELWDELSYKLLTLDSLRMGYTVIPPVERIGWVGKITDRLFLYWYIVQHPCELCFDNIEDSATSVTVYKYLDELRLDSIIAEKNKDLCDTCQVKSRFQYINTEMASLTGWTTVILFVLTLLSLFIYLYGIRTFGSQWSYRKILLNLVRVFFILLVLFLFTWAFCNKRGGIFTSSRDKNMAISRSLGITVRISRDRSIESNNSSEFQTNEDYCDNALMRGRCLNMPLTTFLGILMAGMLAGYVISKFTTTVTENDKVP